jgi:hypothetical protein
MWMKRDARTRFVWEDLWCGVVWCGVGCVGLGVGVLACENWGVIVLMVVIIINGVSGMDTNACVLFLRLGGIVVIVFVIIVIIYWCCCLLRLLLFK